MVFAIPEAAQPGPGVWKLNTSILDDAEYVVLISTFWGRWRQAQGGYPSLVKWWDAGKSRIKGITIAYSSQKAQRATAAHDLQTGLASHLKGRVDAGFVDCMVPYRSTLAQIERLDIAAARGAQVRSLRTWSRCCRQARPRPVRAACRKISVLLLCKGWPTIRPPVATVSPWTFMLNFGMSWVLTSFSP